MKKILFTGITVLLMAGCASALVDQQAQEEPWLAQTQTAEAEQESTPTPQATSETCTINSPFKTEWDTRVCETFENETELWTGSMEAASASVQDGKYVLEYATKVTRGYQTGYVRRIVVGKARDYVFSIRAEVNSNYKALAWGIFVRSTSNDLTYYFMINERGEYSLTGSTAADAQRYIGNITSGKHDAILWEQENTITALVEGTQMQFYVNDVLMLTHEANNFANEYLGIIVWGGEGITATFVFDDVLVREKPFSGSSV